MRLIDADVLKKDLTRFYDNEVTAKRLIDEQPTIESEPHWISVKERLPEEYSEVLCCDTHGEFIIGRPYAEEEANNGFSAEGDNDYLVDCVAWQPLPEPYKEEGDRHDD